MSNPEKQHMTEKSGSPCATSSPCATGSPTAGRSPPATTPTSTTCPSGLPNPTIATAKTDRVAVLEQELAHVKYQLQESNSNYEELGRYAHQLYDENNALKDRLPEADNPDLDQIITRLDNLETKMSSLTMGGAGSLGQQQHMASSQPGSVFGLAGDPSKGPWDKQLQGFTNLVTARHLTIPEIVGELPTFDPDESPNFPWFLHIWEEVAAKMSSAKWNSWKQYSVLSKVVKGQAADLIALCETDPDPVKSAMDSLKRVFGKKVISSRKH